MRDNLPSVHSQIKSYLCAASRKGPEEDRVAALALVTSLPWLSIGGTIERQPSFGFTASLRAFGDNLYDELLVDLSERYPAHPEFAHDAWRKGRLTLRSLVAMHGASIIFETFQTALVPFFNIPVAAELLDRFRDFEGAPDEEWSNSVRETSDTLWSQRQPWIGPSDKPRLGTDLYFFNRPNRNDSKPSNLPPDLLFALFSLAAPVAEMLKKPVDMNLAGRHKAFATLGPLLDVRFGKSGESSALRFVEEAGLSIEQQALVLAWTRRDLNFFDRGHSPKRLPASAPTS
jgi:hypothetical protein